MCTTAIIPLKYGARISKLAHHLISYSREKVAHGDRNRMKFFTSAKQLNETTKNLKNGIIRCAMSLSVNVYKKLRWQQWNPWGDWFSLQKGNFKLLKIYLPLIYLYLLTEDITSLFYSKREVANIPGNWSSQNITNTMDKLCISFSSC